MMERWLFEIDSDNVAKALGDGNKNEKDIYL